MSAGMTAADSITAALRTQADPMLSETLYRNNDIMPLFSTVQWMGGSTYPIKIHYSGNSSVRRYSEGEAIGSPGSQAYVTASAPESHYLAQVQITGHARDYTLNGSSSAVFFNQVEQEFTRVQADLVHTISVDMIGSGVTAPVGIEGIVDSAGALHSLDPSTYTWWAAYEAAGAATTIAISDIDLALRSIRDTSYEGNTDLIITSHKQMQKIKGVYGNPGQSNAPVRAVTDAGGYIINLGDYTDIRVGSIPVIPVKGLTNSIILGVQRDTINIATLRTTKVEQLGKTDDSDKWLVTWAGGMLCRNRKKNWKITTLTA